MKDLITIIKNFTSQEWINIIFGVMLIAIITISKLYAETLQNDITVAREGRDKFIELYRNCVNDKK